MNGVRELPKYQCHKKVWALKIKTVAVHAPYDPADFEGAQLIFEDQEYGPLHITPDWYTKHKPEAGGYYVVYEDGYKSYSPADAFESGYSLLKD